MESTGTPKVILSQVPPVFNPVLSVPIAEAFMRVTRPQRILVLAPMYHINAFATLSSMLTGDQLFVLEKFDAARIVDVIEHHHSRRSPRPRRCCNASPTSRGRRA